jgi:hypothetical protein
MKTDEPKYQNKSEILKKLSADKKKIKAESEELAKKIKPITQQSG